MNPFQSLRRMFDSVTPQPKESSGPAPTGHAHGAAAGTNGAARPPQGDGHPATNGTSADVAAAERPPLPGAGSASAGAQSKVRYDGDMSPFLTEHTRAGLNSRFDELRKKGNDWMLATLVVALCLIVSLGMNVYQLTRVELIPFKVVLEDDEGYLLDSGTVEPMRTVEDIYIQSELKSFIRGLRTVYTDRVATERSFMQAYNHIESNSPASSFLRNYFSQAQNHPLKLAERAQRSIVEFIGPRPLSGTSTWDVRWVERVARNVGNSEERVLEQVYQGSISIRIRPVEDIATAEKNPLGIWVNGLQWEKISSEVIDVSKTGGTVKDLLYPEPVR